jgi:uncharacterized membrane protein
MESRAKLLGHPIHQMLIVFPLGLLAMAVMFDLLALFTGWLGGELVDRLGVGVDDGAHVDAPSSLTHRRAGH